MAEITFGPGKTNYTGEVLNDILAYTAQENETYKHGLVHIAPHIQKKLALPHFKTGSIIQPRVATPKSTDSKGDFTFSERYLEPKDFMVYDEVNPRDFESYYKEFQPTGNLVFRELDPRVQMVLLRAIMDSKNEYINQAIWCSALDSDLTALGLTGSKVIGCDNIYGPMKFFTGALARVIANAKVTALIKQNADNEKWNEDHKNDSDFATKKKAITALTTAQEDEIASGQVTLAGSLAMSDGAAVSKELYAMWMKVKTTIRQNPNLKILMDYKSWDAYDKYLSSQVYKHTDDTAENKRFFRGKQVIPMAALPEDTIIIGVFSTGLDSNLWMGLDLDKTDQEVVKFERLQPNSELYFFKMLMKMDVNIVRPGDLVVHLPMDITA